MKQKQGKAGALLPLATFLIVYLCTSLITGDFYKMPVSVAFLLAAAHALLMNPKRAFSTKVNEFAKGMGQTDIMLMCLIFILAGSFAGVAKAMGAIDATVNLGLSVLPGNMLLGGIFIVACFISLAVGTSVGTIAALTPMAVAVADKIGVSPGLALGAIIGGAMFGDNLSMISDTTIAAARSQGSSMRDKFKANFWIAAPAALISLLIYLFAGYGSASIATENGPVEFIKVVPYLFVLIAALAGVNVIKVLFGGTVVAGIIGLYTHSFDFWQMTAALQGGMAGMSELVIICLLVGGTVALIRANGGIDYIIAFITRRIHGKKGGELGIAALTTLVDICTANNTIAIVISGPIAKDISTQYGIKPARSASIMDTFSCFAQGIIPYGAQLLTAVKLAGLAISPFAIMQYLYYPYLLGASALLYILFVTGKRSKGEALKSEIGKQQEIELE